ncbi:Phage protein [Staphylococcus aureus]|uniref:Uncharacterized protein n=1 Tax=Staphylococcus aureus (strain Mu50 / ATCC 700699) TaxID=158878 RepID=A0A0H3JRB4_STAAM|nr:Phage protein [Staphylococcus aureus]AWR02797.1 hypothetical protein CSB75_0878 [Staphylococcus aureus]AXI05597.1 Phage protein [Staphylococcus aureus]BAB57025.1 hypothetical protein SAV0863 [Staphylococcus aureus subsp. aureus Mu50]BAF77741.1 hypothetical protein SAHV_0858 [Staphylococcus aureus subsp. aureus Mu3]
MTEQTLFEQLNSKNVNDHTEQKKRINLSSMVICTSRVKKD